MASQQKLTPGTKLLDEKGYVRQIGYANEFDVIYNREDIKRPQADLKEWDYHLALGEACALGVSIASVGMMSRVSIHFMDFQHGSYICDTDMARQPIPVPLDPFGDVVFSSDRSQASYSRKNNKTYIKLKMKHFGGEDGNDLSALLEFTTPKTDKMVLVVPYADPELFYYNYKVNCMPVSGYVKIGERVIEFGEEEFIGTNDWGRGIWEPVNQWYWGSASGSINGKPFGFNIGHGFGDTSRATENMIFYDGVCSKIDEVTFRIDGDTIGDLTLILPDENYLRPWRFESSDGRLDLDFIPILDRQSGVQRAEYLSTQHQVFGYYTGNAVLDDGTVLHIDSLLGFAEKVGNDWR